MKTRLGNVTENFDALRRPVRSTERRPGPYPYFGASGVVDHVAGYLFDGDYLLIAEDGENLRSRNTPIAFLAHGKFWVNNHAHIVKGNHLADIRYLSYALGQIDISGYLTGSTLPKLTQRAMESIVLDLPPVEKQRAIAEVLGALDDKIAANTAVSRAADALACAEFEGHRNRCEMRSTTFGEVAAIGGGGTPSTKLPQFWGGSIPWATPTDVTALGAPFLDQTERSITREGLSNCASPLYPAGSILMTSRATIGAFALAKVPLAVNQGFVVANATWPDAQFWLFHEMRARVGDFIAHANGATFLELSRGKFKVMPVEWPRTERVFEEFATKVERLHDRAYAATQESRKLAELRDTLLPHLMSGRLTVRQAEAVVSDAL